jgi:hypothetical protein
MTEQDLFYLLALQRVIEGVGDIIAKKLLTHCSAEAVFQKNSSRLPLRRSRFDVTEKPQNKSVFEKKLTEFEFIKSNDIRY